MVALNFSSKTWLSVTHGLISASLLFIYRSIFWNINVLFDGPLWITFAGCLFTVMCSVIRLRSSQFSAVRFLRQTLSGAALDNSPSIKMAFSFSLMIIYNNLTLYYMDLPMYFVARSLAVPINLILVYRRQSVKSFVGVLLGAVLVVAGYIMTLAEENTISLLIAEGIIFGILASLFSTVFYQEACSPASSSNHETHLNQVYLNNIVCCLFTAIAIGFTEAFELVYLPYSLSLTTLLFWLLLTASCIMSAFAGGIVLRETNTFSAGRCELFGLLRSLLQTVLAVLIYGIYTTASWWVGVLLTATGTAIYWRTYMTQVSESPSTNGLIKGGLPIVAESAD